MTCRGSRRASRSCSTSTPSTRSPTSTPSSPASGRRSRNASTSSTSRSSDRLQPRPLHRACGAAQSGCRDPRLPAGSACVHRGRAHRLGRRAVFGSQVPAGQGHHRPLPWPRRTVGCRPAVDCQGHRRAQLVPVFGQRALARRRRASIEHYSDSGGKSGGQKEKLAYTVLAASLAYQFGLEWGAVRSRSFRFVVIDEAFGRGSDESAQLRAALCSSSSICSC